MAAYHVEEERVVSSLDGLINVSVRAHDARGFATELQGDRLDALSGLLHDELAHFSAACERHLHPTDFNDLHLRLVSQSECWRVLHCLYMQSKSPKMIGGVIACSLTKMTLRHVTTAK